MADKKKNTKTKIAPVKAKKMQPQTEKKSSGDKKAVAVKAVKTAVKAQRPVSKPAAKKEIVIKRKLQATTTTAIKTAQKQKTTAKPSNSKNASIEDTLKKNLILDRESIIKEAKSEIARYIKGETRQIVESGMDDGDWSVIDLSEDINFKRLAAHRERLIKIDAALGKLREGTYWICEDCGEPINVERLKVMPFAIYCRDCQEKKEELEKIGSEDEL